MTKRIHTSRRKFIQFGLGASVGIATAFTMPNAYAKVNTASERTLAFKNLHTGEEIKTTYWVEGEYLMNELEDINRLLRDHRTDEITQIDPFLLDQLAQLQKQLDSHEAFEVISGYRSPKSNDALRQTSSGVAKKSFHTLGKAIDIRLPSYGTNDLFHAACSLESGGVGRYAKTGFIHMDTGPTRSWKG